MSSTDCANQQKSVNCNLISRKECLSLPNAVQILFSIHRHINPWKENSRKPRIRNNRNEIIFSILHQFMNSLLLQFSNLLEPNLNSWNFLLNCHCPREIRFTQIFRWISGNNAFNCIRYFIKLLSCFWD